jgi:fibronectin type 3 domain-containing protein
MAQVIAVAAQKYGFVVDDGSGSVSIRLGDPTTYTAAGLPNPYSSGPGVDGVGDQGLLEGAPASQIMKNFPWSQLQALPFNYGEPDTTPPTVSLAAPAPSATVSGTVAVTATASDNVGVFSLQFELDGKPLGGALTAPTSGSTYSYSWNTTTTPNGAHTLTAIAADAAGNTTTATNITVTVKNADLTPPSVPTGLTATAPTSASVHLAWAASTDNVGVTSYHIYRSSPGTSSTLLAAVTATTGTPPTTYIDSGVSASTTYSYTVSALDAAGNQSAQSSPVSVTTPASPDKTPPSVPTGLHATATTATSITLVWNASTDNTGGSGMAGYHLYRGTALIASPAATSSATVTYTDSGLTPGTNYVYYVSAFDNAANGSLASIPITATTQGLNPDHTPPTIPAGLHSIDKQRTTTSITLKWNASTDKGGSGLAGYRLYRATGSGSFTLIASPTTTTYTNSGLKAGTKYSYYVRAYDHAGNVSGWRRTATVRTRYPWWELWHWRR